MGLSIYVNKVESLGDRNPNDIENYSNIDEDKELYIFENLCFNKTVSYYDVEQGIKDSGYLEENLTPTGSSYGEDIRFNFFDNKHPLYNTMLYLDSVWSKTYFSTSEELFNSEIFIEFKEKHLQLSLDNGWVEKYDFFASGNGKNYFNLVDVWHYVTEKVKVVIIDPPIKNKIERCITYKEIGYQSKGANDLFKDEEQYVIVDLKTLEEHWVKYFSYNEDCKNNFKNNIIDKFIEGETFVEYC